MINCVLATVFGGLVDRSNFKFIDKTRSVQGWHSHGRALCPGALRANNNTAAATVVNISFVNNIKLYCVFVLHSFTYLLILAVVGVFIILYLGM